jgi:hypothetical protein
MWRDGTMFIVYSEGKENISVTTFALSALKSDDQTGGAFPKPTSWPQFSWSSVGKMTFAHLAKKSGPF